jgi:hypothetical protein
LISLSDYGNAVYRESLINHNILNIKKLINHQIILQS